MVQNDRRPTIPEGGDAVSLAEIAEILGIQVQSIESLFFESSRRLKRELRLRNEPFTLIDQTVSANGIAGVIRLAAGVEVEIVPKCFHRHNQFWHDDFLLMAVITRLGRVFLRDRISASLKVAYRDIFTLLAAVYLEEFERLSRVPIREYRKSSWISPTLDGDLDYSEVWTRRSDGFVQSGALLSVDNQFMRVIAATASYLADASSDPDIGRRLRRRAAAFPQLVRGRVPDRVPGRFARWQYLYDLAIAVRTGLGMQIGRHSDLLAPGFILNTERGWEDLLGLSLAGQGNILRARLKPASKLGIRNPGTREVLTYPDFVLNPPSLGEPIIVDAKYKSTGGRTVERISADDLYEALAFLMAQVSRIAILVYPSGDLSSEEVDTGTLKPFEEITIGPLRVVGTSLCVSGVGKRDGYVEFGRNLAADLLEIAKSNVGPTIRANGHK